MSRVTVELRSAATLKEYFSAIQQQANPDCLPLVIHCTMPATVECWEVWGEYTFQAMPFTEADARDYVAAHGWDWPLGGADYGYLFPEPARP